MILLNMYHKFIIICICSDIFTFLILSAHLHLSTNKVDTQSYQIKDM